MSNKITFLISTISGGGAEKVCVNIANGLVKRGWQVDLLVLHTREKTYQRYLSPNINLINLKADRARYAVPALLWYIFRYQPKRLLVFKYELIDLTVILKKIFRLNTKIIGRNISILSEDQKRLVKYKFLSLIMRKFFNPIEQVDYLINQSNEMQKDLLLQHPKLKDKCVVIHNPVASDIEEFAEKNSVANIKNNYILCVGRLAPVKSFHHAIDAFSLLITKHVNLRLKFVGQGELLNDLKQHAIRLGVADKIDFEGFQHNLIPYYRNASVTLLTSNYEGFPNVLIESIVLGTPVVSFDCPSGPREILDYGRYGKLVQPGDIKGLAEAIEDVLENPNQFNLKERAAFFGVDKAIDKYIEVLEKIN